MPTLQKAEGVFSERLVTFCDYFCWLFSSKPVACLLKRLGLWKVLCPFPDSITAHMEFADGSSGQLIYSAEGDSSYPKERLTVFGSGFVGERG
jgi:predicted dehydrogenase